MKIADANIVLRYLLNDTEELAKKATEILENNEVYIPNNYNGKIGISNDFVNVENGEIIKSEDIFKVDDYIGIRLNDKKITKKNSLFRLVKYRLNCDCKNDIRFVFTVDIDESYLTKMKK